MAVVPECRGQGIGSHLLAKLLQEARYSNFGGISLSTRSDNPAAVRLYEKKGFVKVPESEVINRVGGTSFTMICWFESTTIRPAARKEVSTILQFIVRKSEFDRSIGAVGGQLEATEERLLETIFCEHPYTHVLFAEHNGDKILGFALYYFRYSSFAGRPNLWLDELLSVEMNETEESAQSSWRPWHRLHKRDSVLASVGRLMPGILMAFGFTNNWGQKFCSGMRIVACLSGSGPLPK